MRKKSIIIISVIILLVIIAIYFFFFYYGKCEEEACFNSALMSCDKAKYIHEAADAFWLYRIRGEKKGECKVDVKLLQLKKGSVEMAVLEGKEMSCYLPLGSVTNPEKNLDRCSGLLKEEMQKIIINKLHNYVTENLGEISEELKKAM